MDNKLRSQIIIISSIIVCSIIVTSCTPDPDIPPLLEPTRDPVLEESIIEELSGINSEAVPLYQEATRVMDEGDYEHSFFLYEELADLVPEFPTVYRRLSYAESARGNYSAAVEFARKAVELAPNAYNKSALAWALLDDGSPKSSREAYNLAFSSVEELPDDDLANLVLMLSAWLAYEEEVLRESNELLLDMMPGHPLVHYVAGILAVSDGKWFKAERELKIAQALGMSPEAIQEVMDSGLAWNLNLLRTMIWGAVAIAVWLIGLGILYLIGKYLSRTTIEALKKESPAVKSQLSTRERNIRSNYLWVIRILSFYFTSQFPL